MIKLQNKNLPPLNVRLERNKMETDKSVLLVGVVRMHKKRKGLHPLVVNQQNLTLPDGLLSLVFRQSGRYVNPVLLFLHPKSF
ncbi:MAG: hypothetical protein ACLFM1_03980 [Bacteroidales bacterium]